MNTMAEQDWDPFRPLETNATPPQTPLSRQMLPLISLQLQPTLDPEPLGVHPIIATCPPPASAGHPVRSLREVMKMTTHQSLLTSPGDTIFLGAESLSAYSVSLCQARIVQNVHQQHPFPIPTPRTHQTPPASPIHPPATAS